MSKKYLFAAKNFDNLRIKIKKADNILLFLDYDGTLAPFNSNPLKAKMLPESKKSLKKLNKKQKYYLTLISGRKLAELKKMFFNNNLNYAGSHGLEIQLSFKNKIIYPQKDNKIDSSSRKKYQKIKKRYLKKEGVKVEDKGFGLAFHFKSKKKEQKLFKKLDSLFKDSFFEVLAGRKIIEVRPQGWDKGKALNYISREIKKEYKLNNILRIYIGDDSTDEDAFRILTKGITIYVKNNSNLNTEAEYYLKSPVDTAKLLKKLTGCI